MDEMPRDEGVAEQDTGQEVVEEDAAGAAAEIDHLKTEIARLVARVESLRSPKRRAVESKESTVAETAQRYSHHYLLGLINHAPNLIYFVDTDHRYIVANRRAASYLQKTPEAVVGLNQTDIFPPEVAAGLNAEDDRVMSSGQPSEYEQELPTPIGPRTFLTTKFPVYDTIGALLGVGAVVTDISDLKRAEAERLALKEQVIKAQQNALRELSTPLMPLAPGILAMPIVGTIDSVRAHEIIETLLQGISQQGAHSVILDITGVRLVDTQVANALVHAARAARLLGARVVLTGVSPAVAQTLVHLEASLEGIVTMGTLASGINYALRAAGASNTNGTAAYPTLPRTT